MGENNGKGKRVRELFAEEVYKKTNSGWQYERNLLETIIDALIAVGPGGIITDVNGATEKAIGLPRVKIIDTDFSEYFTEPDKARVVYKRAYDIGKVIDYELNLKHISGSSIPVLLNASVYKDNEGQIIGVLANARDISAIKKYEDELIDLKKNLELIVRQKTAELAIANQEKAFRNEEKAKRAADLIVANKELVFQNDEKEERAAELVLANRELVFQTSEKADRAAELVIANKELAFQVGEKADRATELVIADKELVFQTGEKAYRAAELLIANRELIHQNEEKEKRAAELVIANKALESFSYSVSHDLRAPLRHVVGFVELLNEHALETLDDQSRHYLDVISKATNDMGRLIDDLLSFSRIGLTAMESRKVDLNLLIKQVIESFKPETYGRSIDWDIGKLPDVNGDPEMLKLVLSNLISNALKFTSLKTTARIEIGSKPDPENSNQVVFYIKDNGAGFDMQYKEKLFEVFQRLHSQKDFPGTGIGLANVKRVIQRHGGRVWAEGVLEEGAVFYFTLPKYKEEA